MLNSRVFAASIINQVLQGHSLSECLPVKLVQIKEPRDRAFVQAVSYGVCRLFYQLDMILSRLLSKPMKAKDSDIYALLLVGLYQLLEMRVPSHAAVTETVNATAAFKKQWARGLVNAVLREFLRQREMLENQLQDDIEATWLHPLWLIKKIQQAWPDHWQAILQANNCHPPFSLRINQQMITRQAYLTKLDSTHLALPIDYTASGIILQTPVPAEVLPGFAAGEVFIQDGAAQLAAPLLQVKPYMNVLDACAAPGGKLTHLAEVETTLSLTAVEKDAHRIKRIQENLKRLNCHAKTICHDAIDTASWWDGQLFDRILLDAPCSASGVIRRHPDIKLLRQASDLPLLAKQQLKLLEALWPLLKPGGLLLYVTCSILSEENEQVVQSFLTKQVDAIEDSIQADWGIACQVGRQILPGMYQMDGFYYARLKKQLGEKS